MILNILQDLAVCADSISQDSDHYAHKADDNEGAGKNKRLDVACAPLNLEVIKESDPYDDSRSCRENGQKHKCLQRLIDQICPENRQH